MLNRGKAQTQATRKPSRMKHDALALWAKGLPVGSDFKRHWSGKANLLEAVKALRGDVMYASLYHFFPPRRHTTTDFAAHVEFEQVSGNPIWQIDPRSQGFEAPSYAARELLWHTASRIDQRLGLGFAAALAPHKVPKQR